MRKLLLSLIAVSFAYFLIAQKAPIKWGNIPAEDLSMTTYEADTEANALVLCDYGTITFDISDQGPIYKLQRHRRLKILNRSGFDEGDISIFFNNQNGNIRIKAQIIQPNGEITKISRKEMFDEKVIDNWHKINFAFPNITEGCVIEYEYSYSSEGLTSLPSWAFQEDIPVRWSELRVTMPEWFVYVKLFQGQERLSIKEEDKKPLNTRTGRVDAVMNRYVAENLPAIKDESYVTTLDDYRTKIRFQLSRIEIPGVMYETYMTNWEDLANELMTYDKFGDQITKNRFVKNIVEALPPAVEAATPTEKAKLIYAFLANNLEWDGSYGYVCGNTINKVFDEKRGSGVDLNMMLIALLRHFNIDAYPVLLSTRNHGKVQPLYPFLNQFNHVIAVAVIDEKATFLDLSASDHPMGMLGTASLNKNGLLILNEHQTEWIDIIPQVSKDIMMAELKLKETGSLDGIIKCNHKGYSAIYERRNIQAKPNADYWITRFEDQAVDISISEVAYKDVKNIGKSLTGKFNCNISDLAQVVDEFIYLSPILYSDFKESPFKLESRDYPVEIPYPINDQFILNLELPEGYALEDVPEQIKASLPNNGGQFVYMVNAPRPGFLQVTMRIVINQLYFAPNEYDALKNFFDMVAEKQQEQLVLKKL